MSDQKKLAFFLPNLFTALNIGCGYGAVLLSMRGHFYFACMAIALGAVFDSVDGRVARMTGTQSAFGEQFDSMSDLITFGIAPSMIFYNRFLVDTGRLGMIVSFLFLLCAALRLARFNANISKVSSDYFQGLPTPMGAIGLVSYILVSLELPEIFSLKYITIPYILLYGILMVSNVPFNSFKNSSWVREHKKRTLFIIIIAVSSILMYEEIMAVIYVSLYVFGSLIYFLTHKSKFNDVFDWVDEDVAE